MPVREIMSKCVAECTEDMPLEQVYERLKKCEHGLAVVIDSESHRVPIGVVSERSICEQLITRGRNPRGLTAGSVMDSRIKTIRESNEFQPLTCDERESLTAIVVTNESRQLCGIVPKDRIPELPTAVASTQSSTNVYLSVIERTTPTIREIPVFGWIQ